MESVELCQACHPNFITQESIAQYTNRCQTIDVFKFIQKDNADAAGKAISSTHFISIPN